MIYSLPIPSIPAADAPRHPLLAFFVSRPVPMVWTAALALCLSAALAAGASAALSPDAGEPAIASPVGPATAPATATASARARCTGCGVVETVRLIESSSAEAPEYEFTVRLRNGSTRVSKVDQATAAAWSVGDRIMLVGGT